MEEILYLLRNDIMVNLNTEILGIYEEMTSRLIGILRFLDSFWNALKTHAIL